MSSVLLDVPQDLLDWVDEHVQQAKVQAIQPFRSSPAQQLEAKRIAETEGVVAANRYLRSLRPGGFKTSRRAVIVEMLEFVRAIRPATSEAPKPEEQSTQAPRRKLSPPSPKKPGTSIKKSAK